jgi:hypothetical protein
MRKIKTKMRRRKNRNFILLLSLLLLFSCGTGNYIRLRIKMPRQSPVNIDDYEEVAITNFLVEEEVKDFNLSEELTKYFAEEFNQKMGSKTTFVQVDLKDQEVFQDSSFWQKVSPDKKEALFFTGSLEYTEEVRKAIKSAKKRRFEEPFPEESRIEERKFYSLSLRLYLIDTQTGEALFQRTFKESKAYKNPNQTSYFAFYDMVINIRDKLFRQILGGDQTQERYLIK